MSGPVVGGAGAAEGAVAGAGVGGPEDFPGWSNIQINADSILDFLRSRADELAGSSFFAEKRGLESWVLRLQKVGDFLYFKIEEKALSADKPKGVASVPVFLGRGSGGEVFHAAKHGRSCAKKEFRADTWNLNFRLFNQRVLRALREFLLFIAMHGMPGQGYRFAFDPSFNERVGRIRMTFPYFRGSALKYAYAMDEVRPLGGFGAFFSAFGQACGQAAVLHTLGFAHLDIKPQNLVFDPAAKALMLVDFGLALHSCNFEAFKEGARTAPCARPPESFRNGGVDQRHGYSTDVYSLACAFLVQMGFPISSFLSSQGEGWIFNVTELKFSSDVRFFVDTNLVPRLRFEMPAGPYKSFDLKEDLIQMLVFLLEKMMACGREDRLPYGYLPLVGEFFEDVGGFISGVRGCPMLPADLVGYKAEVLAAPVPAAGVPAAAVPAAAVPAAPVPAAPVCDKNSAFLMARRLDRLAKDSEESVSGDGDSRAFPG